MTFTATTGLESTLLNETITVIKPKYPNPALPGILYLHGNTGDSTEPLRPELYALFNALTDAGYTILSSLWTGTSNWANESTILKINDGKTYLQNTLGAKAGKVIVMGGSAGGAAAMVWASRYPNSVACVVGMLPVSDMSDIVANNRGGAAPSVNNVYPGGWSDTVYGPTHNPLVIAQNGGLSRIKMRLFNGANDNTVIPSTVQALAAAAGANTVLTSVPGDHAWSTYGSVNPADVLSFIKANS